MRLRTTALAFLVLVGSLFPAIAGRNANIPLSGSVSSFEADTPPEDVPLSFSFPEQKNVYGGSVVMSELAVISGLSRPASITVEGTGSPEISIDGGPWTTSGTISDEQDVQVRLLAADGSNGGVHQATVTIAGRTGTFRVVTIDTMPNDFSFTDRSNSPLSSEIASGEAVISGLTASASVTVSGEGDPRISVDGQEWVESGTVANGQTLAVRLTSSANPETARTATIDVGGVPANFTVTTGRIAPSAFAFDPVQGVASGSLVESAPVILTGMSVPAPVSVAGAGTPQISIDAGPWTAAGTIANGQTLSVRLNAAPDTNGGSRSATITVGGVSATFVVTTIDTTPDAFAFTDQTGVTLESATTSDFVTMSGLSAPATVSATNGATFSIDGAPFGTSGTISNGQTLMVRLTSSASPSTAVSTTVTVGGVSDSFTVTTGSDVPEPFGFAPVANAAGGATIASDPVTIEGLTLPAAVSVTGGEFSVDGDAWVSSGTISDGQSLAVRLTSAPGTNGGSRTASVTVGGVAVSFVVTTIDTTPAAFGFAAKTGVTLSTLTTSAGVPISGITAPAPVSVTGGEISIAGGAWAASGIIRDGETLAVRLTSAATPATARSATVTVGGVTATWTVTTGTNMPDAFSFAPVANASGGSLVTSAGAKITGITLPVPVSVAGEGNPQISIAGGPWGTSGTVTEGQSVVVRLTAATGTNGGTRTATVTVGSATADFDVTTVDTTPAAFSFAAKSAQPLSTSVTSAAIPVTGITSAATVSVSAGAAISTNGGVTWTTTGSIENNGTIMVRQMSSSSLLTATTATVTIGGVNGTFTVTTGTNVPNAFSFTSVTNAAGGSLVTSAKATMAGMTLPGTVTVSGAGNPQISIAGSSSWVTSGTISNGQTLAVRLTSDPGTNGGSQTATVDVSGRTASFTVTTIDTTPAAFVFNAQTNAPRGVSVSSNVVTITGISAPANVTATNGATFSINDGAFVSTGTINNGQTLQVKQSPISTFNTTRVTSVSVGSSSATFSVTTGSDPATGHIGNTVWVDTKKDGLFGTHYGIGNESYLGGVNITLQEAGLDGTFGTGDDSTFNTVTTSGGGYSFDNLREGTYRVKFVKSGYSPTSVIPAGNVDETVQSNDAKSTGWTASFFLSAGESNNNIDAGMIAN
ncbi:hypothetical protein LAZ40_01465 [Cereibacter sphaeroides]|uniref:beta strand repeat-containing protein n=1 Tax=Cereibacter sphaeroides TaxID=1063 RepID=UPI001F3C75D1|nr:SdrD B-like domain-containing protein [Cereibacter sphaeroides]MCE6957728.1 hypothetical protein [Cereibacter sphaeroides]MCE6971514.1 hypothetical protein [Cereibacter sphaeroides]